MNLNFREEILSYRHWNSCRMGHPNWLLNQKPFDERIRLWFSKGSIWIFPKILRTWFVIWRVLWHISIVFQSVSFMSWKQFSLLQTWWNRTISRLYWSFTMSCRRWWGRCLHEAHHRFWKYRWQKQAGMDQEYNQPGLWIIMSGWHQGFNFSFQDMQSWQGGIEYHCCKKKRPRFYY